jgi:hypothetical protein
MLDDSRLTYQQIGSKFGLTRQFIAQVAKSLGMNGRHRQRQRMLRREPRVINKEYPPDIRAVVDKIRRFGIHVIPYDSVHSDLPCLEVSKSSASERRAL